MSNHRVLAPKQKVDAPTHSHPDFFWSMSGGLDSTAAYLLTRKALHENYQKRPVMLTWDTRIGLPLNRLYLEELADTYGEMLIPMRTHEKFEERVDEEGTPGAGIHPQVRNELKGRQAQKINTLSNNPVHILGLRAGESTDRAKMDKVEVQENYVEVRPVHRLSKVDCAEIVLRHEDCPINPLWLRNHATDCFCLSHGDPSELESIKDDFPYFYQRMKEIEEASQYNIEKGILGWNGLTANEREARETEYESDVEIGTDETEQMTLCGDGCKRERDPATVRAFKARLGGASVDESVRTLRGLEP